MESQVPIGGQRSDREEIDVNQDTAKGKAREEAGHIAGNESMSAKGRRQASKGRTQSAIGDLKRKAGEVKDKITGAVDG